eukprot:5641178-Amphidinium_carterae.1
MAHLRGWSHAKADATWKELDADPTVERDLGGPVHHPKRLKVPGNLLGSDRAEKTQAVGETKSLNAATKRTQLNESEQQDYLREIGKGFRRDIESDVLAGASMSSAATKLFQPLPPGLKNKTESESHVVNSCPMSFLDIPSFPRFWNSVCVCGGAVTLPSSESIVPLSYVHFHAPPVASAGSASSEQRIPESAQSGSERRAETGLCSSQSGVHAHVRARLTLMSKARATVKTQELKLQQQIDAAHQAISESPLLQDDEWLRLVETMLLVAHLYFGRDYSFKK